MRLYFTIFLAFLYFNVNGALIGNYTIDPGSPASVTNYQTFASAASDMELGTRADGGPVNGPAISGPVLFTVASGTYNEYITIGAIAGTSPANTITFDGVNAATTILEYSFVSVDLAIVRLSGTDYTTFKNMTISAPGDYGYGFWLTNQADFNTIENCIITVNGASTSAYLIPILISGPTTYTEFGNNGNYNLFQNNEIYGGYFGVRMNGTSTTVFCDANKVLNNHFHNPYSYGIYSYYQQDPDFSGNEIAGGGNTANTAYGMYLYYSSRNFKVNGNNVHNMGQRDLYFQNCNLLNDGTGEIINNMLGGAYTNGGTCYGLYITNTKNTKIYHNSINLGLVTGYSLYVTGAGTTTQLDIRNNIFYNPSIAGWAFYVVNSNMVNFLDYNDYFSAGASLAYFQGAYANLPAWQAAYPAYNVNSVSIEPMFISNINLHQVCSEVDDLGTNLGITEDFDADLRDILTPDMGADEFTSQTVTVNLGQDTSVCGNIYLMVDSSWTNVTWEPGGTNGYTYFTDTTLTIDVYVIDSNNCRARDTVNIIVNPMPGEAWVGMDSTFICPIDYLDAGNPGMTYLWDNGDTTQTTQAVFYGWHWVDITNAFNCTQRDSLFVEFYSNPYVDLGNDTTFCLTNSYLIDAGVQPLNASFVWSTGATTQVIVVTAPDTFWVQVTTPEGCYSFDTVVVEALPSPQVILGPDRFECDNFILDADPGGQNVPGTSYLWNTGAGNQLINANTTGDYWVSVTFPNGCSRSDTVHITQDVSPIVNLGPDVLICNGASATLDAGLPGNNYYWSNGATTQTITTSTPGTYIVVVSDPVSGCSGTDGIIVSLSPYVVNLGPDFGICTGQSITLDAGGTGTTFSWSTGANSQTITVNNGGNYVVTVTFPDGCSANDAIQIAGVNSPTAAFTAPANGQLWQPINFTDNSSGTVTSWEWDFDDGQFSAVQNPSHTFQAMGNFNVCLTAYNGLCGTTVCHNITIVNPVGIENEVLASGIELFPNPSDGIFNVRFNFDDTKNIDLLITDIQGRTIWTNKLNAITVYSEQVDISSFSKGIYIMKVITGETVLQYRIVKAQ